eukprot:TRINITY_DN48080_c0_g1_i1.p1 TRINITY_DN48080_c0_g1~~TRINITY_DN48080_c0_g1_i1.p1  ORF type:complete len:550 (-),score=61.63 TRINITY_DN48080_c0_g1_i1:140-1696(-)
MIVFVSLGTSLMSISCDKVHRWLCGASQHIRRSIRGMLFGEPCDELDPFSQSALAQVEEERRSRVKTTFAGISYVLTAVLLACCWNLALKAPRMLSFGQDVVLLVSTFVCVVAREFGLPASGRAIVFAYVFAMIAAATFTLSCLNLKQSLTSNFILTCSLRMSFVPCYMDVRVVIFGNFACTFVSCLKFVRSVGPQSESHALAFCEVVMCVLIIALSEYWRHTALDDMRKKAIAKENSIEHSALKILLEHTFDVVLPLDAEFGIVGNETQIAAMLMLDTTRPIRGVNIQEFMSFQEDKNKFRQQFNCKSSDQAGATSPVVSRLNVRMRDGLGNNVCFEVFGVAVATFCTSASYWIGMRECSDIQLLPPSDPLPMQSPRVPSLAKDAPRRGTSATTLGNSLTFPPSSIRSTDDLACSRPVSSWSGFLAVPQMPETKQHAKVESLRRLIASWNFDASRKACCTLHACVPEVKMALDSLSMQPCVPTLHASATGQCVNCGLIRNFGEDGACTLCHSSALAL